LTALYVLVPVAMGIKSSEARKERLNRLEMDLQGENKP
jgi:hypothetical protein